MNLRDLKRICFYMDEFQALVRQAQEKKKELSVGKDISSELHRDRPDELSGVSIIGEIKHLSIVIQKEMVKMRRHGRI